MEMMDCLIRGMCLGGVKMVYHKSLVMHLLENIITYKM